MRTFRGFQRLLLACGLVLALAPAAFAHAFLSRAEPSVGGTVARAPAEVKLWFTQAIEPGSSLGVVDPNGKQVDARDARVDARDRALLRVSLPPLPAGVYTVRWRAVSADAHATQGHFEFTIRSK